MMNLHPNWKKILKKAWSVRLIALAGLFSGLEVVFTLFQDVLPRGLFAALTVALTISAAVARVVSQRGLLDDT